MYKIFHSFGFLNLDYSSLCKRLYVNGSRKSANAWYNQVPFPDEMHWEPPKYVHERSDAYSSIVHVLSVSKYSQGAKDTCNSKKHIAWIALSVWVWATEACPEILQNG